MKRVDNPTLLLQELMRRDFRAFLRKVFPTIRGGDEILWNWHLDAIAYELDRIDRGENQRLLVTLPPRNLKSIAISVAWVAWMLGRDPRRNFVCISYSNELSGKLARDCLAIMQSGWYRALFPRTILSPKRSAAGDFETTRGGGRLATSITGTLTGRGGDILIIDDPIKPDEAYSDTTREAVNNWFRSTLTSRLNDKASGAIVTVMQRLHENDLAGMLLETPGWRELRLSAIATEDEIIALPRGKMHYRKAGDVLHPERESLAVLEAQRLAMGSLAFEAQYQQNPLPAVGNMVKAEWLRTYTDIELAEKPGRIVQSWDTASKDGVHNDYSVCITASIHRNEIRIIDVFRAKLAFPELKQATIRLARQYRARTLLIEDAASGQQLLQVLRNEKPREVPMPISRKPEGDKLSRMAGVSGQIEGGQLLLPENAPWLAEFKKELLGFPNARHDDQADALTQLMNWGMQWDYGMYDQPILGVGAILFVDGEQIGGEFKIGDYDPNDDPWGPRD